MDLLTGVSYGAFLFSAVYVIKETQITGKICFNIIFVIIITQIVLVIVAAYFIFRVDSCVFIISAAFAQLCVLQVCAIYIRIYLNRILTFNRSLQIQESDPVLVSLLQFKFYLFLL